jgi:DNA-binding CsgD family transcriptional regulator
MTMSLHPDTSLLLGTLYDAVTAEQGFQDFIEALCEAFASKSVTMMTRHLHTQEVNGQWTHGISLDSYIREYGSEDVLALHIQSCPIALFYASNLDVPYPEQFPLTRFYQEWVVPQGIAYATGATVLREGDWITQIYLQRSPQQQPFDRAELDLLNGLVPHLQRAIQLRQRFIALQSGQQLLASSLDALAMPALLFDEYCRIAHINRSAAALLASTRDCWVEDARLRTSDRAANRLIGLELTRAVAGHLRDIRQAPSDLVPVQRSGRSPLILKIASLNLSQQQGRQQGALMFLFAPERSPGVSGAQLKQLFGLTAAEADLAVALCRGCTLEEAATTRARSIHTIRSQLKSIFVKTGTNRQTDLVSMLLTSPAYFYHDPH